MGRQKPKTRNEQLIQDEEIGKSVVDKNLIKINSIINSQGRQDNSRNQKETDQLPIQTTQNSNSNQSRNDVKSLVEGNVNIMGSVNDRDEELSTGSKQRQDFHRRQEQIISKNNKQINIEEVSASEPQYLWVNTMSDDQALS